MPASNASRRFDLEVSPEGRLEITALPPGELVTVLVVPRSADDLSDLVQAATSSTDFWDNALDDEDWNHA